MSINQVWEDIYRTRKWGAYPAEELIRCTARNFYDAPDRSAVRILEVGCGTGANLWYFCREGFTVSGIDGSPTAIEIAAESLGTQYPDCGADLRVGDITALPHESESFDFVVDNEAAYSNSFEDAIKIYAEIARVLRPGGVLYSRTFAKGCVGDETGERLGRNYCIPDVGPLCGTGAARFTSLEEIDELLPAALEVVSIERLSRTIDQRRAEVAEWIIEARKK